MYLLSNYLQLFMIMSIYGLNVIKFEIDRNLLAV